MFLPSSTRAFRRSSHFMPFQRNSLGAFLHYAKRSLAQAINGNEKVNVVIGNESAGTKLRLCDWDQCFCTLIFPRSRFLDLIAPLLLSKVHLPTWECLCPSLRTPPEHTIVWPPPAPRILRRLWPCEHIFLGPNYP